MFEPAIRMVASGIILAHNHPSDVLEASDEDVTVTNRLKEAARLLDIELLDHVIVTKQGFLSMREEGLV